MYVDDNILESIVDFRCPCTIWTHIWVLYFDPKTQPFLDDPLFVYNVQLHSSTRIPYDYDNSMEFNTLEHYEALDEDEVSLRFVILL